MEVQVKEEYFNKLPDFADGHSDRVRKSLGKKAAARIHAVRQKCPRISTHLRSALKPSLATDERAMAHRTMERFHRAMKPSDGVGMSEIWLAPCRSRRRPTAS